MNKVYGYLAVGAFSVMALPAFAVVDVTAATTGISDATTAVTTVLAALITMGAAFFGLKKVKRLIGG